MVFDNDRRAQRRMRTQIYYASRLIAFESARNNVFGALDKLTIEDTTPPVVTCAAVSFEDHAMGIEYTVEDEFGEVTGSAAFETRCCPLPVVAGQIVKVICKDHEECRPDVGFDRGRFGVRTDEAALVVTATDQCGNEATCTVELCGPAKEAGNGGGD